VEDWLDLSTGLNPQGWPVPACSPRSWQRLPEQDDGLEQAAAEYYGSPLLLPVAGSQPAIQLLPTLRPPCRVGMLPLCYAEHPWHWEQHGHRLAAMRRTTSMQSLMNWTCCCYATPTTPPAPPFPASSCRTGAPGWPVAAAG
jgi:cobalamin biosynthetic protein CobC